MDDNRIKDMELTFENDLNDLLKNRLVQINNNYNNDKEETKKNFLEVLQELDSLKEGTIVISYLRSSFITQNHEFYISCYSGEPFVEECPDGVFYSLKTYFKEIEDDYLILEKLVKSKFIQVFSWELEEIRRNYMERVYAGCIKLFCDIFLKLDTKIRSKIYYGEYMSRIVQISTV